MNAVWRESRSTGRARLVLLAIADHQGEIGAWPSIKTLARMVNASERSVQRDITELQELGELEVHVQEAPSRGQYKSNLYWVILPSVADNAARYEEENSGVTDLTPGVTKMQPGVTESTPGVTAVGVLTLIEPLLNHNKTINAFPSKTDAEKLDRAFAEFWEIYPRKSGKAAAKKSFAKAYKQANGEVVLGARRYATDPNLPFDKNFIPHPATWLNQGRWEDEPLPHREKSKEELLAIETERRTRIREADRVATEEFIRASQEAEKRATAAPRCEHGNSIVSCKQCFRKKLN